MTSKPLSQLAVGRTPQTADLFYSVQGGQSVSVTGSQLSAFIGSTLTFNVVSVKDFGATGLPLTFKNLSGGSGYTGGDAANQITQPTDFSNAYWSDKHGITISGTSLMVEDGSTGQHSLGISPGGISATAGATYTYSRVVTPGLRSWCALLLSTASSFTNGIFAVFHLSGAGAVGATYLVGAGTLASASIVANGDGSYTCTIKGVISSDATLTPYIYALLGDIASVADTTFINDTNLNYTGSNGSTALTLGTAQLYKTTTYTQVALSGGTGTLAKANIEVGLGGVLSLTEYQPGSGYTVGDTITTAAANIGGTGSGFTAQIATLGNDTAAIQAAVDSGGGSPVSIYFPPGTYNIRPPTANGVNCINLNFDNVTLIGAGQTQSIIKMWSSGGRQPEFNWDVPTINNQNGNGALWRGTAFWGPGARKNHVFKSLRVTGQCPRRQNHWPYGGPDPGIINAGNPLGSFGDGQGWDGSHHAVMWSNNASYQGPHWMEDCEFDSFMGEIFAFAGGPVPGPPPAKQLYFRNCHIHDTYADGISCDADQVISGCNIHDCTNCLENEADVYYEIYGNFIWNCSHGCTIVGDTEGSPGTGRVTSHVYGNRFQNCFSDGVFVRSFAFNVDITDNIFIDCGGSGVGPGSLTIAPLSAVSPDAHIQVAYNKIYANTRTMGDAFSISLSQFDNANITNVLIRDNIVGVTEYGRTHGAAFTNALAYTIQGTGSRVEFWRNNFGACQNSVDGSSSGRAQIYEGDGNVWAGGLPLADARIVQTTFSKTSDTTFANIPDLHEQLSDRGPYMFDCLLLVSATAGGAKVRLQGGGGAVFAGNYDVELWAGTTLDAASGQQTALNVSFGSNASITKIRIGGVLFPGPGATGVFAVQFAQNTSNGTASSVLPGSYLRVRSAGCGVNT